jgi:hypothetical protein
VLRWAASAVDGSRVISVDSVSRSDHRPSGTFRLIIEAPATRATDVIWAAAIDDAAQAASGHM